MDDLNFVDQSDFMFHRVAGKITSKEGYYQITHQDNQDFIWGNYYAFLNLKALYQHNSILEAESVKQNGFFAFSYNVANKQIDLMTEFEKKGFEVTVAKGMVRSESMIAIKNENLLLGVVETHEDWQEVIQNQRMNTGLAEEETLYLKKRFDAYQKLIAQGLGYWFYAKKDGRIVGDLGIFFDQGDARFQQVVTLEEARNQGVCQSLVSYAGNYCLNKLRMKRLIIVAEEGSVGEHIYQKLGFEPQIYTHSFFKGQ